jgi:hypothetical protein
VVTPSFLWQNAIPGLNRGVTAPFVCAVYCVDPMVCAKRVNIFARPVSVKSIFINILTQWRDCCRSVRQFDNSPSGIMPLG